MYRKTANIGKDKPIIYKIRCPICKQISSMSTIPAQETIIRCPNRLCMTRFYVNRVELNPDNPLDFNLNLKILKSFNYTPNIGRKN